MKSVPRMQFALRRMLEAAFEGIALTGIEDCSRDMLDGRPVCGVCADCAQAWLAGVDPYIYDPIDDRMAELWDAIHEQRHNTAPSYSRSAVIRLKALRLRRWPTLARLSRTFTSRAMD